MSSKTLSNTTSPLLSSYVYSILYSHHSASRLTANGQPKNMIYTACLWNACIYSLLDIHELGLLCPQVCTRGKAQRASGSYC